MNLISKYNLGQTVHYLHLGAPNAGKIVRVTAAASGAGSTVQYECETLGRTVTRLESELFPTRKALLATR